MEGGVDPVSKKKLKIILIVQVFCVFLEHTFCLAYSEIAAFKWCSISTEIYCSICGSSLAAHTHKI